MDKSVLGAHFTILSRAGIDASQDVCNNKTAGTECLLRH